MAFSMLLMGDVQLGRLVDRIMAAAGPAGPVKVWGNTLRALASADVRILNLECALTRHSVKWPGEKAFHFKVEPKRGVEALQAAHIDGVCLANNHVLDYCAEGAMETLAVLDAAHIAHAGAGPSLAAARAPGYISTSVPGVRIALLSMEDNEPEWRAGEGSGEVGTNHLDVDPNPEGEALTWLRSAIAEAKVNGATLIVLACHWGTNWVLRPSSRFVAFAHRALDAGVDVLFGHSPHVAQGVELYHGKVAVYGAGDFIDDYAVDERWHNDWGFAFKLHFDLAKAPPLQAVEMLPVKMHCGQTNLMVPGQAEHVALCEREVHLCRELGTAATLDADGHLWCRR
jgi:poly-gamma-glutamate capsule biosynthesis protein CapA/YwtB (metallophosphatase superfamily)